MKKTNVHVFKLPRVRFACPRVWQAVANAAAVFPGITQHKPLPRDFQLTLSSQSMKTHKLGLNQVKTLMHMCISDE